MNSDAVNYISAGGEAEAGPLVRPFAERAA